MEYIISQIFVCLSYIFLGLTYFIGKRKIILLTNLVSLTCNGIHYMLLGAWAGFGVVCIAVIRNVLFLIQQKIKVLDKYVIDDWILLIALLSVSLMTGVLTYDSIFSLFTIVSSMVFTISLWQKNNMVYKILGIIASALGLVYLIYISSILGIILESLKLTASLVAAIIYFKNNKNDSDKQILNNANAIEV